MKRRAGLPFALLLGMALWVTSATATQVSGSLSGSNPGPTGFAAQLVFTCALNGTTCTGIVNTVLR